MILLAISSACLPVFLQGRVQRPATPEIQGVVAGSGFSGAPGAWPAVAAAAHYRHAQICADANNDGVCGPGEPTTTTDAAGAFVLADPDGWPLVADISTDATIDDQAVPRHLVLRALVDLGSRTVVVSPLSTEIVRMMEADGLDKATAQQTLGSRIDVPAEAVAGDPATITDGRTRASLLRESVILTNRFSLAAAMADRHDLTIKAAQQEAMNLEAIPRYDHLFIVMLENKATSSIVGSPFAPKINDYLKSGNQFTSYFSTGNPSEPNRLALAAGDDFGITDDAPWNCVPEGDSADLPEDPLPVGMPPCANPTNHNIRNRPNLFSAMSAAGMTWRVYSESMNPGRDWRLDSAADETILAPDRVYPADSPVGAIGVPGLMLRLPARLYATKHNGSVNFQAVRNSPEFVRNNRTLGGGQWDAAMQAALTTPAGWNVDQFGSDLASGDVGNLNFLEPDQCDDMHGVKTQGTTAANPTLQPASDCGGDAIVYRGDTFVDVLIRKIQASSVWTNRDKRTAIVIMFDEGKDTTGFTACCGWNPSAGRTIAGRSLGALTKNADGSVSIESIAQYSQGNKGHGTSIFCVLTNQPLAPKHVVDSDAYSHISFVRTIQDMFGLADPGDDWSYMNRTKYTQRFIDAHPTQLPEYVESGDPHFDAVRAMNHAYAIPADYLQKSGFLTTSGPQRGPDATQLNAWALTRDEALVQSTRR
ncbi:MAG TPA: alkaline phosphatase family protein [Vicinamibacterales bacterium]